MSIIILTTERLRLQVPERADLDDLIALRTDIDVMRNLDSFDLPFGSGEIQDIEEIKLQLRLTPDYYKTYGLGFFCAFEQATGAFIGQAGLFHQTFNTDQPLIELAYRLHKRYWGRGYATELATALIHWGLYHYQLPSIIAPVHPDNQRSIRVLEKSGMQYSGTIQHQGHELPCYTATREPPTANEIVAHNKNQYNLIAPTWHKEREWYIEKASIDQAIHSLQPGDRILDIGCGNAQPIGAYLHQLGFAVEGIDIADQLIDFAKHTLPAERLHCGDFRTYTFPHQYHAVVCWFMLFHLDYREHANALARMHDVLLDNGILVITFADTTNRPGGSTQIIDDHTLLSTQFGKTFYHSGNPAPINHELVIQAGFEVLSDLIDQPGNQVIIAKKLVM